MVDVPQLTIVPIHALYELLFDVALQSQIITPKDLCGTGLLRIASAA